MDEQNQEENSKHEEPLQEVIQFTVLAFKALALIRIGFVAQRFEMQSAPN